MPTKLLCPNLIKFCNQNLNLNLVAEEDIVEVSSKDIFNYPYVYMTGHGNVVFSPEDAANLKVFGGRWFLHVDDNYGMDKFVRLELKKVFLNLNWLNFLMTTQFTTKSLISRRLPKSMNMMASLRKDLVWFMKADWWCTTRFEYDLGNGWKTRACTTIQKPNNKGSLTYGEPPLIAYCFTIQW